MDSIKIVSFQKLFILLQWIAYQNFLSIVKEKSGVISVRNTMADVFYQHEFESVQGGKSNFLVPICEI